LWVGEVAVAMELCLVSVEFYSTIDLMATLVGRGARRRVVRDWRGFLAAGIKAFCREEEKIILGGPSI
jgi:hypothetical protein